MTHYAQQYQRRLAVLQIAVLLLGTLVAILAVSFLWMDREPKELMVPFVEEVKASETPKEVRYSLYYHLYNEANIFGINPDYAFCIIQKESNFNTYAVGDSGKAVGLAQFHLPTWQSFRKQMGESTKDTRICEYDTIRTFIWALHNGLDSHWTASRYCQEFK